MFVLKGSNPKGGGGKLSIHELAHEGACHGATKQKGMFLVVVCRPWRTLAAAIRGIIAACVYNREYVDSRIIKIGQNFVIFEIA